MDIKQLSDHFAIPGVLSFDEHNGLIRANVATPAASATIYLQGAHLAHWQPAGQQDVLYMSKKTAFEAGKPIRGGVPLAFPWFAVDSKDRWHGKPGPMHGFARIQDWTLAFAAQSGDDLHLTFTLGPTALSREMGFDHFRAALELTIGRSLTMKLAVANDSGAPLVFEEAMHTYFHVAGVRQVSITGLEPTSYLDKTDGFKLKPAAGVALTPSQFTDRIYNDTAATCSIHDPGFKRTITIAKEHSDTTVVFNPWKAMPDLGEDEWPSFVCVETVNAGKNAVTIEAGKTHVMTAHITITDQR
ncbi:MAG: D-hexose-6-phosphate mutarotase [Acidobacteria bacterium]|nr:D-hexose-6-phosphate mutarotase [Acidobacteriota bacterium]